MQIIDIPIPGIGDVEVDEAAGILTIKTRLMLGGQEEDASVNIPIKPFLEKIADGFSNPILKWVLNAAIGLLP